MFTIFKLKVTNINIKIIINIPAFFIHSWYYQQPENYVLNVYTLSLLMGFVLLYKINDFFKNYY